MKLCVGVWAFKQVINKLTNLAKAVMEGSSKENKVIASATDKENFGQQVWQTGFPGFWGTDASCWICDISTWKSVHMCSALYIDLQAFLPIFIPSCRTKPFLAHNVSSS